MTNQKFQDAAVKFLGTNLNPLKKPQLNNSCIPVMGDKGDPGNCFSPIMDNLGAQLWTQELEAAFPWTQGKSCQGLGFLGLLEALGSKQSSCGWEFQVVGFPNPQFCSVGIMGILAGLALNQKLLPMYCWNCALETREPGSQLKLKLFSVFTVIF